MSDQRLSDGTVVFHQRRSPNGGTVVDEYTVRHVKNGVAVMSQPGTRKLARVGVQTILASPAWAIQEALW